MSDYGHLLRLRRSGDAFKTLEPTRYFSAQTLLEVARRVSERGAQTQFLELKRALRLVVPAGSPWATPARLQEWADALVPAASERARLVAVQQAMIAAAQRRFTAFSSASGRVVARNLTLQEAEAMRDREAEQLEFEEEG